MSFNDSIAALRRELIVKALDNLLATDPMWDYEIEDDDGVGSEMSIGIIYAQVPLLNCDVILDANYAVSVGGDVDVSSNEYEVLNNLINEFNTILHQNPIVF